MTRATDELDELSMPTESQTVNQFRAPAMPLRETRISEPPARSPVRSTSNGNGGHRPEFCRESLKIILLGLSLTSSFANRHATTYRGLVRELTARGHRILFLERDRMPYAAHRDLPKPAHGRLALYSTLKQLKERFTRAVQDADLVIVGSGVEEGAAIGEWVTRIARGVAAFYDLETPVTLTNLSEADLDYLCASLIPRYHLYLSSVGGPILDLLEKEFGSPMARPLYCSVDTNLYYPEANPTKWDLGYLGAYAEDRQPGLDELLLEPARRSVKCRFTVAGSQYPKSIPWPKNVSRFNHLPPAKHRAFYTAQRFALNLTRENMVEAGYSPGVRLFEAAACGIPIISDFWEGLDTFFTPGHEILLSSSAEETLRHLREVKHPEARRIGARARARVLASHTAKHRALELETYALDLLQVPNSPSGLPALKAVASNRD